MINLILLTIFFPVLVKATEKMNYVYCHGLGGSGSEAIYYVKNHFLEKIKLKESNRIIEIPLSLNLNSQFFILYSPISHFNHPSGYEVYGSFCSKTHKINLQSGIVDYKKVSLGQAYEINELKKAIDNIKGDCILFGRSMGASTIINYMSLYQTSKIKALVLEAPFHSIEELLNQGFLSFLDIGKLAMTFPAYNPKGIKPIESILKMSKDIPIIFIHSKKDTIVPIISSIKLFNTLVKFGYKKVHFLELHSAGHNDATISRDASNYQNVVHAFYKHYGLPHESNLAELGKHLFYKTQSNLVRNI